MPLWDQLKLQSIPQFNIFEIVEKTAIVQQRAIKKHFKEEEDGLQPSLFSLQWRSRSKQIPLQGGDTLY